MQMTDTRLTDAARRLAEQGWAPFPVAGKEPLVRWKDYAGTDGGDEELWSRATGIGVDCGRSRLVVIDVDDPAAQAQLEGMLGRRLDDDQTLTSATGKGRHYIYRAHGDPVTNARGTMPRGIDVRGDGGYVVVPPSAHPDGGRYEWHHRAAPVPFPDDLRAIVTAAPDAPLPAGTPVPGMLDPWTQRAVDEETAAVRGSLEGGRNDRLFKAGLKLYSIDDGRLTDEQATALLLAAARHAGLTEDEARKTLASARERATQNRAPAAPQVTAPVGQTVGPEPRQTAGFTALTVEDLEALPEPEWLLEGRLPRGQTWLFGEPGVGKSFVQLDWGATVAAKGGSVLAFLGEGVSGFAQRVTAWRAAHPGHRIDRYRVVPTVPYLLQPDSVEALAATVRELSPDLIIIDTFARSLVGGDENSAQHVGQAIDVLDRLWRTYGTSSLVVHHSRKNGGGERGSGAIRGAADAMWEVKRYGADGMFDSMQVECVKMKDAEEPPPWLHQVRQSAPSAVLYPSALDD